MEPKLDPEAHLADLHKRIIQHQRDGEEVVQFAYDRLCSNCQAVVRDDLSPWLSGVRAHMAELKDLEREQLPPPKPEPEPNADLQTSPRRRSSPSARVQPSPARKRDRH